MLPNFIVIGAPRCGTTAIHANLQAHPEVFVPKCKETHFFDRHYDQGIARYEAHFADWNGEPAVGELTPGYLHGVYSPYDIPRLIHTHLPDVRLIASLRNPVERVYSEFWYTKGKDPNNARLSFEEKLERKPEFIREGFYYDQLRRYYDLFPAENILVLLYDDLLRDPRAFMQRVYAFIGVRADFESGFEQVHVNAAAGKRRLTKSRLLWLATRLAQRMRKHALADRLRRANAPEIPPMSPDTRQHLVQVYREQNLRLQELIGRDLGHWISA